ncbi:MAG: HDIG domain-containing protein, partial [Polyangiaceae bacterium]|nr:HDIG domain-containing protein [Polyangiaceae bacterium]
MSLYPSENVTSERAIVAMRWAADVANDPETAGPQPPKPTPAVWREHTIEGFREYADRLLVGRFPEPGLDALLAVGALDVWLPEIAAMVGFGDGEFRHKDVWKHTKQVVKQSVPRLEVRWGALLHDIGKPKTRKIEPDGAVTFYGHSEVGAAMFRRRLAKRLGFEGELRERIHFLILHHLRASQYDGSWTDSAVRRFYKQMGEGLKDLLDLSRADITTKRMERRKRGVRQISALSKRIRDLQKIDEHVPPLPKGLGTLLSSELGIPPSKLLGEVRRRIEEDAEEGVLESHQDAA